MRRLPTVAAKRRRRALIILSEFRLASLHSTTAGSMSAGLVASIWLVHGLYNKLLGGSPRHLAIVQSVPGLHGSVGERVLLVVGGFEVTKQTMLMAELHGTSRMNFDRDTLAANFGIRQPITERCIFIGSLGHEVRTPEDKPLALIGYFGVQLLY